MSYQVVYKENNAHEDAIWTCKFGCIEEKETFLVTGSFDADTKIWHLNDDTGALTLERTLTAGEKIAITCVDISKDGKIVGTSGTDGIVRVWDRETGQMLRELPQMKLKGEANLMAFSNDGRFIAIANRETGRIDLYSFDQNEKIISYAARDDCFNLCFAFSTDSRLIACGAIDGTVRIYDVNTHRYYSSFETESGSITALKFSHDMKLFCVGCENGSINLYDASNAALVPYAHFDAHLYRVVGVEFALKSAYLASVASFDKSVRIWNTETRSLDATLNDHNEHVCAVSFDRNDALASCSEDQGVIIYKQTKE